MLWSLFSVTHATACIVKPISKTQEAAQREIEEAMKKVKEAQSLITAAVDEPSMNKYEKFMCIFIIKAFFGQFSYLIYEKIMYIYIYLQSIIFFLAIEE